MYSMPLPLDRDSLQTPVHINSSRMRGTEPAPQRAFHYDVFRDTSLPYSVNSQLQPTIAWTHYCLTHVVPSCPPQRLRHRVLTPRKVPNARALPPHKVHMEFAMYYTLHSRCSFDAQFGHGVSVFTLSFHYHSLLTTSLSISWLYRNNSPEWFRDTAFYRALLPQYRAGTGHCVQHWL